MVRIVPSLEIYNELSSVQEALCLVLDFAAEFNMGQFIQAENVPGSLKAVSIFGSQLDVLHITILEALFDLAGAKGHNDSRSALTMTQNVWESYRVAGDILEAVKDSTLSHRERYDRFLDMRSKQLERQGFRRLSRAGGALPATTFNNGQGN